MKRSKPENGFRHVTNQKRMTVVYGLLRLSVLLVLVAQFFNRNYENVFRK